jgi:hypothetical protein
MTKVLKYASAVVAAMPGLAALFGAFTLPPDYTGLFKACATSASTLAVLGLMLYWRELRQSTPQEVLQRALLAALIFLLGLLVFIGMHLRCVVVPTNVAFDQKAVFFPLWLSGEVAQRSAEVGGRLSFVNKFGPTTAVERIREMPWANFALWLTIALMLLVYIGSNIVLALAFAFFALYLTPPDSVAAVQPPNAPVAGLPARKE